MLLVSTIRSTNQMSDNMLVLIYTIQSIHTLTCCRKTRGKSEKLQFIDIGSFGLSGGNRIWRPNIGRFNFG